MLTQQLTIDPATVSRTTEPAKVTNVQVAEKPNGKASGKGLAAAGGNVLPLQETQRPSQQSEKVGQAGREEEGEKVKQAVTDIADFVQNISRDLEFSVDEESGRVVITVLDSETKEVIRQIPPEEVLKLAHNLHKDDGKHGVLFQGNA